MSAHKEKKLIDKIVQQWGSMPIPPAEGLKELHYEYGQDFFDAFAGKGFLDVDQNVLDEGSALLFMDSKAGLFYLASYMLAVLHTLPKRREGEFVLDQLLTAHLFGQLEDILFLQKLSEAGLSRQQAQVIKEFICICIESKSLLNIQDSQCIALDLAKNEINSDNP